MLLFHTRRNLEHISFLVFSSSLYDEPLLTFSLSFFTRKKRNQKALVTASRSVATDYFPSSRSFAKNDKTPDGQTMPFS